MESDPKQLRLSFGELKRVARLLGLPDKTEIWVEQRPHSGTG